jgi:hypothetical protein
MPRSNGGCFAGDVHVLLADSGTRPISQLAIGDHLASVSEVDHMSARPNVLPAVVEAVHRHDGAYELIDLGGIYVTPDHRWATRDRREPDFVRTSELEAGMHDLLACQYGRVQWLAVPVRAAALPATTVWNLTVSGRTFCVAARREGPFFVVHNAKPSRAGTIAGCRR